MKGLDKVAKPNDIMREGLLGLAKKRGKSVLEIAAEERPSVLKNVGDYGLEMLDVTVDDMIGKGLIRFPVVEAGVAARVEQSGSSRLDVLTEAIEATMDRRTKLALKAMLANEQG